MTAEKSGYYFGGIKEFNLEQIESEVLNESIYLDVFAGSDLRIKSEIAPIQDALAKVQQLHGITFDWNRDAPNHLADSGRQAGLIAQEVAAVMPELVRADRDSGVLAVNYPKLTTYLVESIKELSALVSVQDERIRHLENRIG